MDFSFIIPVYNCKDYLAACVESIRSAGLPSYEILLIDDGSTDGSSGLCDELAAAISQVRVVHQSNSGVATARNTGISNAIGDYVLFVDSDDTLDSAALKDMLSDPRCMTSDLTIFGIRFDFYRNNQSYRSDSLIYDYDGILERAAFSADLAGLFRANSLSSSCTKVFRRRLLLDSGLLMNTSMFLYEDLEFVLRYLSCCENIFNVPTAIYHYRQAEDEGNAGRRLSRIDSIPHFLQPIEAALSQLREAHPGITEQSCRQILQQLHTVLAREKIAVSDLNGIRKICREYAQWERSTISAPEDSRFRQQLLSESAVSLWLNHKKSHIRHRIAVFVKAGIHRLRSSL